MSDQTIEVVNNANKVTVKLDGLKGSILAGGNGQDGDLTFIDNNNNAKIDLDATNGSLSLHEAVVGSLGGLQFAPIAITLSGQERSIKLWVNNKEGFYTNMQFLFGDVMNRRARVSAVRRTHREMSAWLR
jgi:Tfp pilus assembly protein FimT